MARYKQIDTSPCGFAVSLHTKFLPGTSEDAQNRLLDHAIELSAFDTRFKNDDTQATTLPPAILLKVVFLACCRDSHYQLPVSG